ncbi:MAG: DUF47 family protein [Deltaproteobacteria bacterium]|nr:DUF47 family protein [Deltaproteobacteria bacterium]
MGLQGFVRFLLPRADHFYEFLERQANVAHEGALALARFGSADKGTAVDVCEAVQALEHQGDGIVHEMEEALAKTFVTPLDREDLQRLSMELDDVLDLTNAAARVAMLYGVERPTEAVTRLMGILVEATALLAKVLPALRKHRYGELIDVARVVRKLEKDGDTIFRQETSRLFHDVSIDPRELIRQKTVLDDLEAAIDRCEHVASTLMNLSVKHG